MDGHVVYESLDDKSKGQSLGALMSGLWQAAGNIVSMLDNSKEEIFRLSYDSSDSGIYILPLTINGTKYIYGYLFENEINPGLIKSNFRNFRNFLEVQEYTFEKENKGTDLLFGDLSDEEMDNIFSAIRN